MKLIDYIVFSTMFATSVASVWLFYGLLEMPRIVAICLAVVTGPTVVILGLLIATRWIDNHGD
jgi:uncharacterized integral membrane protein